MNGVAISISDMLKAVGPHRVIDNGDEDMLNPEKNVKSPYLRIPSYCKSLIQRRVTHSNEISSRSRRCPLEDPDYKNFLMRLVFKRKSDNSYCLH